MPNPTQPMNEEELLLKVRRKAQFFHRGCPADDVIDGDADLEKCTCGVDDQLKDIVKLIIEDRNAAIREARKPLEEILDGQGWNRCDDCNDFIPLNDECLCENCDAMFHEGCAGYVYDGDGEYPSESAYAICKKCYSQSQPNAKEGE